MNPGVNCIVCSAIPINFTSGTHHIDKTFPVPLQQREDFVNPFPFCHPTSKNIKDC